MQLILPASWQMVPLTCQWLIRTRLQWDHESSDNLSPSLTCACAPPITPGLCSAVCTVRGNRILVAPDWLCAHTYVYHLSPYTYRSKLPLNSLETMVCFYSAHLPSFFFFFVHYFCLESLCRITAMGMFFICSHGTHSMSGLLQHTRKWKNGFELSKLGSQNTKKWSEITKK